MLTGIEGREITRKGTGRTYRNGGLPSCRRSRPGAGHGPSAEVDRAITGPITATTVGVLVFVGTAIVRQGFITHERTQPEPTQGAERRGRNAPMAGRSATVRNLTKLPMVNFSIRVSIVGVTLASRASVRSR